MREICRLKKLLTWTNMSLLLIAAGIFVEPTTIAGSEFAPEVYKADAVYLSRVKSTNRQLACLARNVYYEAGNEPFKGQLAVAQVTVNRANSQKFPDDLCDVVSQRLRRGDTVICQFSWYCDSRKNKTLRISESHPSYIAARRVFLEGHRVPKLGKDTYYFHNLTVSVSDSRPYKVIAQIGNHIFYRREK
jgi:spore germination cell wall hydrolase CwlJ-like protein